MKRNRFIAGAVCFLSALSFSCSNLTTISIPKKIAISTDAVYNVNLGDLAVDLSETLNSDGMLEQMRTALGASAQVYDYINAEEDVLTYAVHYPLYTFPLNVGSYLSGLDIEGALAGAASNIEFKQDLKVDASATSFGGEPQILEVDIKDQMATSAMSQSFTVPVMEADGTLQEVLTGAGGDSDKDKLKIEGAAEHCIYGAGSAIKIEAALNTARPEFSADLSGDFDITLRAFISRNSDGTGIISQSSATAVSVKNGGTISIPIGKDVIPEGLPSVYYVCLEGETSGSNMAIVHGYDFEMGLAESTVIEKVEGLIASQIPLTPFASENFDIDLSSAALLFDTADILEGNVSFNAVVPDGWSGITARFNIKISGAGINCTQTDFADNSAVSGKFIDQFLDLAGKQLNFSSDSKLTVSDLSVEFDVDGGSIDFTQSAVQKIEINYSGSIKKLGNVTIKLASLGNVKTSYSIPEDKIVLQKELANYVSKISFGEMSGGKCYKHNVNGVITSTESEGLGLNLSVFNSLDMDPSHPLKVKIKSNVLKYNHEGEIEGNMTVPAAKNWASYEEIDLTSLTKDADTPVDFTFTIGDTLYIKTFEVGKDYEFSIKLDKVSFDWDMAILSADGTSVQNTVSMEGFNIGSLLSSLNLGDSADKIQITSLPVFFYAQTPDKSVSPALKSLVDSLSLRGTIAFAYQSNGVPKTDYILGAEGSPQNVVFMTDAIEWPVIDPADKSSGIIESDGEFAQKYLNEAETSGYSFFKDISNTLNSKPENLGFDYSLGMINSGGSTLQVYSAMMDGASSSDVLNISIDMAILVPLKMTLTDDINLNLMTMFNPDYDTVLESGNKSDLFNRESADSMEQYAKYADSIDSLSMNYTVSNELFKGLDLSAHIKAYNCGIDKTLTLYGNRRNRMELSGQQIKNVFTNYPFHPDIEFTIGGGPKNPALPYNPVTNPYKEFSISRKDMTSGNAKFGANIAVCVDFNKNVPVEFPLAGGN